LAVGLSTGIFALVDCARCEVMRQESLDTNTNEALVSIAFSNKKKDTCYVAGKNTYVVTISPKIKLAHTFTQKKHMPTLLTISANDSLLLECAGNGFLVRDLSKS
jgi:hypothetical protein